jgi:hypothetical protein
LDRRWGLVRRAASNRGDCARSPELLLTELVWSDDVGRYNDDQPPTRC